jgi:hypothetical protein
LRKADINRVWMQFGESVLVGVIRNQKLTELIRVTCPEVIVVTVKAFIHQSIVKQCRALRDAIGHWHEPALLEPVSATGVMARSQGVYLHASLVDVAYRLLDQ